MINLMPHPATLMLPDGSSVTFPPSGDVARVSSTRVLVRTLAVDAPTSCDVCAGECGGGGTCIMRCSCHDVPVHRVVYGDIVGLPAYGAGPTYIVSGMVLAALAAQGDLRDDVVGPDTGAGAVRDAAGRIVGTTGWVCA